MGLSTFTTTISSSVQTYVSVDPPPSIGPVNAAPGSFDGSVTVFYDYEPTTVEVSSGANQSTETGGGSDVLGGAEAVFDDVTGAGDFSCVFEPTPASELTAEEFLAADLFLGSDPVQMWDIDFTGEFNGRILLTLGYDDTGLLVPEEELFLWHLVPGGPPHSWEQLFVDEAGEFHDIVGNRIAVYTDSLSPFILGEVPEPAAMGLLFLGGLALLRRRQ